MTAWIFQCNPETHWFPAWEAYRNREPIEWWDALRNYQNGVMHQGDPAGIWIAGKGAGLYAAGEIGDPLDVYFDSIPPGEGWNPDDVGKGRWWIRLQRMRWLDQPILRTELKQDPRFRDAEIMTWPRLANAFRTTDAQWCAITSRRTSNDTR